ncbi:transposase [Marinicella rhabdoformis]|uniref:transposase n=1 Tax=Marinicella rhabdoformis TaxID=2580566 RepID=UPI0012AEC5D2|nr:transposase [Marinicella rhabdoformis]
MPTFRRVFVENSYVFITVAINNRKRQLLTDYISEFRLALKAVQQKFKFNIHAIVVLPEHFHMILKPQNITEYPRIVSLLKINFTKSLPNDLRLELSREVSLSKV